MMPQYNTPEKLQKHREANKRWREKYPEKIKKHRREQMRKAIAENPEKFRKRSSEWRKKHPEFMRNYRKKVPLMATAQNAAIKNIEANQCEICGSIKNLERHHRDYCKPLEVNIVCKRCHNAIHHSLLEDLEK
jgi:hypothetical protein